MLKEKLTYFELHRQLDYTSFDGLFRWKIDKSGVKKGTIAGGKYPDGYIRIRINGKSYAAHRLAWFYVYGYLSEYEIDHKKGIKWDNRIRRLRESSRSCNMRNTGNPSNNTSTVKGVYWNKDRNKWQVQITINKSTKNLGYHEDFDEAVCHRLAGEQCLNWEGCADNSPAYQYVKNTVSLFPVI